MTPTPKSLNALIEDVEKRRVEAAEYLPEQDIPLCFDEVLENDIPRLLSTLKRAVEQLCECEKEVRNEWGAVLWAAVTCPSCAELAALLAGEGGEVRVICTSCGTTLPTKQIQLNHRCNEVWVPPTRAEVDLHLKEIERLREELKSVTTVLVDANCEKAKLRTVLEKISKQGCSNSKCEAVLVCNEIARAALGTGKK